MAIISAGRGRDWLRAVTREGWGRVDLEDMTPVIDHVLREDPRLDPSRVGIMGGSYGGFLTAWTIAGTTDTDRRRSSEP